MAGRQLHLAIEVTGNGVRRLPGFAVSIIGVLPLDQILEIPRVPTPPTEYRLHLVRLFFVTLILRSVLVFLFALLMVVSLEETVTVKVDCFAGTSTPRSPGRHCLGGYLRRPNCA